MSKTEINNATLINTEQELELLLINTDEPFVFVDTNLEIVTFNEQFKKQYSHYFGVEFLKGTSILDYAKSLRVDIVKNIYQEVFKGQSKESEIEIPLPGNANRIFLNKYKPAFCAAGKIIGAFVSSLDITEQKKAEAELKKSEIRYKQLAGELAASNAELEEFAYIASHDLQEPLRMVTSFLKQLETHCKDQLDDRAKQYIFFATDGAVRMRKLILDLLDYSLAGKKIVEWEVIDINELLFESVQLNRKIIDEKEAVIEWDNLLTVKANRISLLQVFQNLMGNALKYQKKGCKPVIKINIIETPLHWQFSFSDNGIGIEPRFFDKIFLVFQRLHTKDEYPGIGLGLAICKKIVENYGGKIWLESTINQGSTFYFTIIKQQQI